MKTIHSYENHMLISFLREARDSANLTQTQLSELLEKPQSYVSKYERGERRLDVIEFLEICRQIKADPHAIIDNVINRGSLW